MERPMARFPQAVRVGDLIGRKLIEPSESQGLLGHVVGVARRGETVVILAKVGGLFGRLGGHVVALPATDVALLGEHVALLGMLPREAAALPRDAGQGALAPDATIELTLVGPFH